MERIIRLTERDLTRIVKRVIKEQEQTISNVGSIPCIKHNFVNEVYKIENGSNLGDTILKLCSGTITPKVVMSPKNVILIDKSDISVPEKKYGSATIVVNGVGRGKINLDGTTLGEELYTITDVVYNAQNDESKFKIGWVLCDDGLYIYDISE
jgi:hypothetical protein